MLPTRIKDAITNCNWGKLHVTELVVSHGFPSPEKCTDSDWRKLERLLRNPPGLAVRGWTYFEAFDTLCRLIEESPTTCLIAPPGLKRRRVDRCLCHHPYSAVSGGARRWTID